jgi:hypothetical protein
MDQKWGAKIAKVGGQGEGTGGGASGHPVHYLKRHCLDYLIKWNSRVEPLNTPSSKYFKLRYSLPSVIAYEHNNRSNCVCNYDDSIWSRMVKIQILPPNEWSSISYHLNINVHKIDISPCNLQSLDIIFELSDSVYKKMFSHK